MNTRQTESRFGMTGAALFSVRDAGAVHTNWFATLTHLGRGDGQLALASTESKAMTMGVNQCIQ